MSLSPLPTAASMSVPSRRGTAIDVRPLRETVRSDARPAAGPAAASLGAAGRWFRQLPQRPLAALAVAGVMMTAVASAAYWAGAGAALPTRLTQASIASPASAVPVAVPRADLPRAQSADAQRPGGATGAAPAVEEAAAPAAPACVSCGRVERVVAVQRKGQGSGAGAVAGGVVGGVLGHQMGGGNGRKALTVLGAIGGGLAGHEIEKRARAVTVYQVRVRMDDGSLRTLEQPQSPAVGARVRIEGRQLQAMAG